MVCNLKILSEIYVYKNNKNLNRVGWNNSYLLEKWRKEDCF